MRDSFIKKVSKVTFSVPLIIIIFWTVVTFFNPSFIDEYLETLLVDYRFRIRNLIRPPEPPEDIVIVAVDERALSVYGRWPWSRSLQAELIEKVFEDNPKLVVLDIFYSEPETPETDKRLAEVLSSHKSNLVVALGFEAEEDRVFTGEIPEILYDITIPRIENLRYLHALEVFRVLMPPEPIASSAVFGHVYSLPDRDGKLRWEPLYIKYGDEYLPSLALQGVRIVKGISPEKMGIIGGAGVYLDEVFIPTDKFGRLHINYYGPESTISYISASDVLSGKVLRGTFTGKIVLIGTSAVATYDLKVTPFSANMPGVEKNATVMANILKGDFIRKTPLYIDLLVVLVVGILSLLAGRAQRSLALFILYSSVVGVVIVINIMLFVYYGVRANLVYPLFTVFTIGSFTILTKYFIEEKKARYIKKIFSSYVTERVVNELIKNPNMARLGGERREVTVLFADIRGFTRFSEKNKPEEVVTMLNEYLSAMTEVIFRWEGTLNKFIGDAIVAFWGAPMPQEDHAERALRCALHMINKLGELQKKWRAEGKTPFNIGIGINTGEVIVGNIGAESKKMDYTVIGDHVNLGARLESLTKKYNVQILISGYTLAKIRELISKGSFGHVVINGLERVVVKGKEEAVEIYEFRSVEAGSKSVIIECAEHVKRYEDK